MITFTDNAIERIRLVIESPDFPAGYYVRVGLKGSACSSTYLFGLDKPSDTDELHRIQNIEVLIDKRHLMYLIGLTIDYQATDTGEGFTFQKNEGLA